MNKDLRNEAKKLAIRSYIVEVNLDETTDGEPVYLARTPELEGCFGQGKSIDDAVNSLNEARVDYIYSLLEDNLPIPGPYVPSKTTASLTSTLTLSYRQIDVANPSDTQVVDGNYEKPLRLYAGVIRV